MSRAASGPFRHNRLDKLETMLERAEGDGGGVLVVVDGVFSMEGDVAPLPDIVDAVPRARRAADGRRGARRRRARRARRRAPARLFGVEDEVDLRMGTFSKSLASCGGFIAGPADVIDFLRIQSRSFMFTAAAVPAAVGAGAGGARDHPLRRGAAADGRLLDNARYLHDGLAELGFHVWCRPAARRLEVITPIVPVLVGDDWEAVMLWKALYDAGVYDERRDLPGRAARRRAAAHERDGDARARAPRPRPRRSSVASRARSRRPQPARLARSYCSR